MASTDDPEIGDETQMITNDNDGDNGQTSTAEIDYAPSKYCTKKMKIIYVVLFCLLVTGVAVGVTVFFLTRDLSETPVEVTTEQYVNKTTIIQIRTNDTFINETITVLVNGSYVNQTVTTRINGTVMNVTTMETVVVKNTYTWWDRNGAWQYALNGADVVEYHNIDKDDDAVAGNTAYQSEMYGIKWLFKDQANKDLFDANPEKYVPKYGAHCAYAMARNYIASGDPDAWTLYGGDLFINYNKGIRSSWGRDIAKSVADGDANWEKKAKEMEWSNPK